MKNSNNSAASVASTTESKNAATNASKCVTTNGETRKRVSETRDDWGRIELHTVKLILLAIANKLPDKTEARKGYGFKGANADGGQPHSREYACSLLAALCSKKAGKIFAASENCKALADDAIREAIAVAIATRTGLGGSDAANAKKRLSKCTPKRAKWLAGQIIAAISEAKPAEKTTETEQPKTPAPKRGGNKRTKKAA